MSGVKGQWDVLHAKAVTTQRLVGAVAAVFALALLVTSPASAATVDAPKPWRSYPLNQVEGNLAAQARQDGCDFARRQSGGRKALLIFLMGRANEHRGRFGVGDDDRFTPNKKVANALLSAGRGYKQCRSPGRRADIAYGVTNYELTRQISSNRGARRAGRAQARVAKKLARKLPRGIGTALAGDIEPGWDPSGSGRALSLTRGAAGEGKDYYNFGTAGKCRPFGTGCQGNWTYFDIGRASQDEGIIALPEIYYPKQAQTWARVANKWDNAPGKCRRRLPCYDFGGVTSFPVGCAGATYTPRQSWLEMRRATRRTVERRIIYFNPRRIGCSGSSRLLAEPAPVERRLSLPLMPAVVPGEIVEDPEPIVSDDVMSPLTNAWRVGSHTEYTWVYAGGEGVDPITGEPSSDGSLIITRERYRRHRPMVASTEQIDVVGSGALRISGAPLGRAVTGSAHRAGELDFTSESGIEGTLDLSSTTVTLDEP